MKNKIKLILSKEIWVGLAYLVLVYIPTWIVAMMFGKKTRKEKIWIISERAYEARDNGYHLFKYICENFPDKKIYYAIRNCKDRDKVCKYGEVISFGSYNHCYKYILAECVMSTGFDMGCPNAKCGFWIRRIFRFLKPKSKVVFLQHGITKDKLPTIHKNKTNCDLLITGAYPEYQFLLTEDFGYDETEIKYTGFARYDNLFEYEEDNTILFMPTWRHWLNNYNFENSEYCNKINDFLNSNELEFILKKYNIRMKFLAHPRVKEFSKYISIKSDYVQMISNDEGVQEQLKKCKLFITDYSSTYFDVGYMGKPIIYYQYDYEKYRNSHYPEGYFKYEEDGFGPIVRNLDDLIDLIDKVVSNNFRNEEKYKERAKKFFAYRDQENCKRIYNEIVNICK